MCMQTNMLLGLPFNATGFYFFVFGSTLVQYNLHYVTKTVAIDGSPRLEWTRHMQRTHRILIALGAAMILYSLVTFPLVHYLILLVLGMISFLYSFPFLPFPNRRRLKDFGVLKILILSLIWTLVTVWFPVSTMPFETGAFWFVFAKRFVFVFVLCMIFDIRDRHVDAREGIQTIAVLLGKKDAYAITWGAWIVFIVLVILGQMFYPGMFWVPLLLSAAVTGVVIRYSKKHNTDITCLFFVDGMMLLQALLVMGFGFNN